MPRRARLDDAYMTTIPSIEIFVRHSADCEYASDERAKSCRCRKHLRWSWEGKQYRTSAKTRSWKQAENARREIEIKYELVQSRQSVIDNKPTTVEDAIAAFLAEKRGSKTAQNTLAKYKLTLSRLQEFCDRTSLTFLREVQLQHLSAWRDGWSHYYDSVFALRNNQSRVRHFFSYCRKARMISDNPAADLSAIRVTDDDFEVDPFTKKDYEKILKTIPTCDDISDLNKARVSTLVKLQRWSGLSLVDAVCLGTDELVKIGDKFRVDTNRRKTGSKVSNVIPAEIGRELLKAKNGNTQFFFWTGESTPKSAAGVFDKLYRKVFEKAGIINGGSHRLRHLFAVSLLERGVDIRLVSKALGHKSLAVTERYYAKWSSKQQENLAQALTKAWN